MYVAISSRSVLPTGSNDGPPVSELPGLPSSRPDEQHGSLLERQSGPKRVAQVDIPLFPEHFPRIQRQGLALVVLAVDVGGTGHDRDTKTRCQKSE